MPISARPTRLTMCAEGVLLCNPETDTVFLYSKNKTLSPVLHKIPLAGATDPMTYMNNCIDVGNYQFTEIFTVRERNAFVTDFPVKYYMRNKKTGEVVHPRFLLPEYRGKEFFVSPSSIRDSKNGCCFELDLVELKQAFFENRLSGKLKELVATLKEDDNNVFMMVQFY